jgi:hypothetical protein
VLELEKLPTHIVETGLVHMRVCLFVQSKLSTKSIAARPFAYHQTTKPDQEDPAHACSVDTTSTRRCRWVLLIGSSQSQAMYLASCKRPEAAQPSSHLTLNINWFIVQRRESAVMDVCQVHHRCAPMAIKRSSRSTTSLASCSTSLLTHACLTYHSLIVDIRPRVT